MTERREESEAESTLLMGAQGKRHTLTWLLYDSLLPPTGTTMTCAGDSHSGLEGQRWWVTALSVSQQPNERQQDEPWSHHFPAKFSARMAIILSRDPSTALWIITGLWDCPSRLKRTDRDISVWWFYTQTFPLAAFLDSLDQYQGFYLYFSFLRRAAKHALISGYNEGTGAD